MCYFNEVPSMLETGRLPSELKGSSFICPLQLRNYMKICPNK